MLRKPSIQAYWTCLAAWTVENRGILCDFGDFEAKTAAIELVDRSYIPESMHSLSDNDDSATGEWQTGYKTGLIGNTIHLFTILMQHRFWNKGYGWNGHHNHSRMDNSTGEYPLWNAANFCEQVGGYYIEWKGPQEQQSQPAAYTSAFHFHNFFDDVQTLRNKYIWHVDMQNWMKWMYRWAVWLMMLILLCVVFMGCLIIPVQAC